MLKEAADSNVELIVYYVVSPERGPERRIFGEEEIHASGGIHAIERTLESESYWFVRLGTIQAEAGPHGITFSDTEFSKLTVPSVDVRQVGRRNPGFRRPELERLVFTAIFRAVERLLTSWNIEDDGVVDAYTLKELKISSARLASLTNGLLSLQRVHEIAPITVMKYWYDVDWPEPHEPDTVLAEYSLDVPFQVQWSAGEEIVDVRVLPLSLC